MGVLGESASLVSVQEDIVDIQRGSNQRLVVCDGSRDGAAGGILLGSTDRVGSIGVARQCGDGPQALINRTDIKVNFYFVILYITILPHLSVYFMFLGSRLYLKPSTEMINLFRPKTV